MSLEYRVIPVTPFTQNCSVVWCAATRKAALVATEGDTFPLGILDEVNYQETRIVLSPGDQIIFYTDGIVEAMNEKEEMFGFERLLATVEESSAQSAEALLNRILSRIRKFCGSTAQHDDLTVIVLKAAKK